MTRRRRTRLAIGAGVVVGPADAAEIIPKFGAVARSQLGEGCSDTSWQGFFLLANGWSRGIEDSIGSVLTHRVSDNHGVDVINRLLIFAGRDNTVLEIRFYQAPAFGLKGLSQTAWAGSEINDVVRNVAGLHRANVILRRQKKQMRFYRENAGLRMDMVGRRKSMTSGYESERAILDQLQTTDGSGGIVRKYYGRRVIENGADDRLEGRRKTFLIVSK